MKFIFILFNHEFMLKKKKLPQGKGFYFCFSDLNYSRFEAVNNFLFFLQPARLKARWRTYFLLGSVTFISFYFSASAFH